MTAGTSATQPRVTHETLALASIAVGTAKRVQEQDEKLRTMTDNVVLVTRVSFNLGIARACMEAMGLLYSSTEGLTLEDYVAVRIPFENILRPIVNALVDAVSGTTPPLSHADKMVKII